MPLQKQIVPDSQHYVVGELGFIDDFENGREQIYDRLLRFYVCFEHKSTSQLKQWLSDSLAVLRRAILVPFAQNQMVAGVGL